MTNLIGNIITVGSLGMLKGITDASASTIESAIYTKLAADPVVSSLVSTRIFPNVIPQGESMPAIAYQMISGAREHTTDGPEGLCQARFQVTCWAGTYSEAKQLSEAVRKELDGYRGTVSSVVIDSILLENELDAPRLVGGVDVLKRFGKILDFVIWFEESTS